MHIVLRRQCGSLPERRLLLNSSSRGHPALRGINTDFLKARWLTKSAERARHSARPAPEAVLDLSEAGITVVWPTSSMRIGSY
ncbi:hypothetical protein AGR2A_Lc80002 [Agrobacterium genomosp. 2 str. CFBP 5494]|uniref:Uncharacterized protein n=1 Tax=Agrobacterium genomosp. 2 str. CFBP 5494 TaxID=1183436 RepID=A0A9W5B5G7_9HYPH|nr:hypothetical protein AGR2A_Lc80002 [Agrobacterium genomosp. 2 str. CFBP 5494]